jgi:hypothetical protein
VSAVGFINSGKLNTRALWFFMGAWLASFIFGFWMNNWQRKSLKAKLEKLAKKENERNL